VISSVKVSIVIPVYNGADFVNDAINSALSQTYKNIEILVVNDGSTDGGATEEVTRKYGNRIRYFFQPNGGVASALNLAISEMKGEYFSWLSHDDLYQPEKVEAQVEALSRLGVQKSVSYCDYSVFGTDPIKAIPVDLEAGAPEEFRYWLTTRNALHGCTLLIPRIAFDECGGFDQSLLATQDYDLWFRMAEHYQFLHLPRNLVLARSHPNQDSRSKAALAKEECNRLLARFARELRESEILGTAPPEALPSRLAGISASMFRRRFFRAGYDTILLAIVTLRPRGWYAILTYMFLWPPRAVSSMLVLILKALFRIVKR